MSTDQSQMFIAGRVASDIKTKIFSDTSKVVEFRIATNHSFKDRDGQWQDGESSFFQVQCWDRLGTNVAGSLTKGDPVIAIGRMLQSSWTVQEGPESGATRSMLRLRASHVGPDLNQREVQVFPDRDKRMKDEEKKKAAKQRAAEAEAQQQDPPATGWAAAHIEENSGMGASNYKINHVGERNLPVDEEAFADA